MAPDPRLQVGATSGTPTPPVEVKRNLGTTDQYIKQLNSIMKDKNSLVSVGQGDGADINCVFTDVNDRRTGDFKGSLKQCGNETTIRINGPDHIITSHIDKNGDRMIDEETSSYVNPQELDDELGEGKI